MTTLQRPFRSPTTLLLQALLLLTTVAPTALAQEGTGTVHLQVESHGTPLSGAEVRAGATSALTDALGRATLRLTAGRQTISVRLIGYAVASERITVVAGMDTTLVLTLQEEAIETEGSWCSPPAPSGVLKTEDEPLRVEVLVREEIEEKMLMTPGDISMMLNETSGLRVQTTSPSLGGARSQGSVAARRGPSPGIV